MEHKKRPRNPPFLRNSIFPERGLPRILCSGRVPCRRFSALPAGNRNNNGSFNNVGNNANFWSATENDTDNAYNRNLNYNNANMNTNNNNKNNAFSVRCVQDFSQGPGLCGPALLLSLYNAYREARRHKRNTLNQLRFEVNFESELFRLARELETRTYRLSPSVCFINEEPVKREIVASDFRDRVVQHLLFSWINPIFERQFIYDTYNCRKGKGTLFGIHRAQEFLRAASDDYRRDCWALRLDVKGFFMAIDRERLFSLILDGLRKARFRGIPDRDLCLFLLRLIIFADPLEHAIYKSPPSAWKDLPMDKSLRFARPHCGLPIGNLTSQLFGNVYLNPLDHFVKRSLKVECYGRYVDDMLFVGSDKGRLLNIIEPVRDFLRDELSLTLHPRKISLQPASRGFAFLGAYVLPYRVYPGRRIRHHFFDSLHHPLPDPELQDARMQSYRGLLGHFDSWRMRKGL